MENPIIGPPEIIFSGCIRNPPAAYATTKREINSTMLPADAGCIVNNVETLISSSTDKPPSEAHSLSAPAFWQCSPVCYPQCRTILWHCQKEFTPVEDVTALSKEEIIAKVKEAGVVGMGGAGFPTHVKLSPKEPGKIEYIIANCAECEPYLTADYRRMLENPKELIEGMRIVLRLFDNAKGLFGIEIISSLESAVTSSTGVNSTSFISPSFSIMMEFTISPTAPLRGWIAFTLPDTEE